MGEDAIQKAPKRQHASGYFRSAAATMPAFRPNVGILLRYYDHAATAEMQRTGASLRRALDWLESRVSPRGVINVAGNTRTGAAQERDRTGAPRRVSAVAVSRAFGPPATCWATANSRRWPAPWATARQPG